MTTRTTRSNLPRFRRDPDRAAPIRLTDRDREVFYTLFHYRYLTTSLLIERHFGSATRGRTRLRLLYHHGFLERTWLASVGPATGEAIYSLGRAAIPELVAFYGLEPDDIRRRRKKVEPLFVAHELLVARFRLRIAYTGAPIGVSIADWRDGGDAKLRVETQDLRTGALRTETLTPDGVGRVVSRRARFTFAVECDRGTMTAGRVREKFRRYVAASATGAFADRFGAERFRVLVVVPSAKRLSSLKAAARDVGARRVWLTTEYALTTADPIRTAIWHPATKDVALPLLKPEHLGLPGGESGPRRTSPDTDHGGR